MTLDNAQDGLHMTIAASPSAGVSLANDLRLVKAALLYADRAKLCSLGTHMLQIVLAIAEATPSDQVELLEQWMPVLSSDDDAKAQTHSVLTIYKLIAQKQSPTLEDLQLKARIEQQLTKLWKPMKEDIVKMAVDAGAVGMGQAIDSGLLDLHAFSPTADGEEIMKEYYAVASEAVANAHTYPLFDDPTAGLIKASINEGKLTVSKSGVARGRHAGFVSQLFERLTLFDEATVDEILDIRRELERPLVRFRSAVIGYSKKVESAAWDDDFPAEAREIFIQEVEPAVQEIEQAIKSNRDLLKIIRRVVDKPLVVPATSLFGFLGMALSTASSLPWLATEAATVGLPAGIVAFDVYMEQREKREAIEQNHLFFYYQLRKRLAEH